MVRNIIPSSHESLSSVSDSVKQKLLNGVVERTRQTLAPLVLALGVATTGNVAAETSTQNVSNTASLTTTTAGSASVALGASEVGKEAKIQGIMVKGLTEEEKMQIAAIESGAANRGLMKANLTKEEKMQIARIKVTAMMRGWTEEEQKAIVKRIGVKLQSYVEPNLYEIIEDPSKSGYILGLDGKPVLGVDGNPVLQPIRALWNQKRITNEKGEKVLINKFKMIVPEFDLVVQGKKIRVSAEDILGLKEETDEDIVDEYLDALNTSGKLEIFANYMDAAWKLKQENDKSLHMFHEAEDIETAFIQVRTEQNKVAIANNRAAIAASKERSAIIQKDIDNLRERGAELKVQVNTQTEKLLTLAEQKPSVLQHPDTLKGVMFVATTNKFQYDKEFVERARAILIKNGYDIHPVD